MKTDLRKGRPNKTLDLPASKIASNQVEDRQNDQKHNEDRQDLDFEILANENEPT